MKFIRTLFISLLIIACLIGFFTIYFAAQVSAVYDPLKSYSYSMTRDKLKENLIQVIKSKPNFNFSLTDSTGTNKNDLNYYANISMKIETEEYEFHIKYYGDNSFPTVARLCRVTANLQRLCREH